MAEHLREQTLPEEMVAMADYYLRGVKRTETMGTAAVPRQDMPPSVASALGLDVDRTARHEEVVNLLSGLRADGSPLPGAATRFKAKSRDRITYVDFTFSAPKSVSVAMALAPTDAERHMIVGAHRDAWMAAMAHLETIVGRARKGRGGSKGSVPGKLAWVSFDHYTARPTIEIPHTEADGTKTTLIQTVRNPKVAGDMQLHTHVTTPNVVVCEDGSVGSMDMLAMHDRVHEVGAYYQAHLATNLRAHGIDVVLDEKTDTARVTAVPASVCEVFSKRTRDGEAAARDYVAVQGLDWDGMHPMELAKVLKGGARATRRQKETGMRGDDLSDLAAWKAQAEAAGYRHESVISAEVKGRPRPSETDRLAHAYLSSLPVLEKQLGRRATMYATAARTAAARGLIAAGVESVADIDRITAAMREHGVRHDGEQVPLVWAKVGGEGEDAALEQRRPRFKITTTRHIEQEQETMRLAAKAAADRSAALTPGQIERAVQRVSERDQLDFSGGHGLEQRRIIDALGTGGRFAVAVGVGGAGKTTLLRPLVEAWTNSDEPDGIKREVYGTALAWRQSTPLADAGIKPQNAMAIAALLHRAERGKIALGRNSVVVVDELSQIGTAQALKLARLQDKHGFTIVAIGDDKQAQAIEAGSTIRLLRKALRNQAIPALESTVRQLRERDKETSLMFRRGDAAGGIARLREDGHAVLVQGGRRHAIEAAADLWEARHKANAGRDNYTLTVSAPTNSDARAISTAIRDRKRKAGKLGGDEVRIEATDQNGARYEMPLAVGDRVRLFARTHASFGGKGGNIGHNGSVVAIERIAETGVQVRNAKGSSGFVKWDTLRDEGTKRIRLTYGDVISIDAIQSATSTEHLNVLPGGSTEVESFKNYVAQSRARETTWLVVSDGAERSEILNRRALGNADPISEDEVWANVARNLSRQPEKELATDLLAQANGFYTGTVRSLATAFQPKQQREAQGQDGTTLHQTFAEQREEQHVARAGADVAAASAGQAAEMQKVAGRLTGPNENEIRKAVRDRRRSVRAPGSRPKRKEGRALMSETDAQAEFADVLHRAGLRPKGAPIMDGKKHRVPVEGDRRGRLSGTYIGHLTGYPAGYIHNFKTGEEIRWKASRPTRELAPAERARLQARMDAERAERESERLHREAVTSHKALAIWNRASAVRAHPYLARKDVASHGLRQDRRGNLLVPMRDVEGRLWSIQTISETGQKLYMKGGRKQGTHAMLGELQPGAPLVIAEGYATAATIREITGLATVAAFDSANLMEVAQAYRARDPERPIILAGDNDHHLPNRPIPLPNVGQEKATAAAEAVNGIVLLPGFAPDEAGTDWNDFVASHGRAAVRQRVEVELTKQGIELPTERVKPAAAAAAPKVTQADRDAARQRVSQAMAGPAARKAAQEAARRVQQQRSKGATL
ncbi:MAG TPA: MobF family relaxase [Rhodopila sp.]|nr:MobF family relaxase [Rhodopila sp.]